MSLGVNDKVYFSHKNYTIDGYLMLLEGSRVPSATKKHFVVLIKHYQAHKNLKGLETLKSVLDDYSLVYMYKGNNFTAYIEFREKEFPEVFDKIHDLYFKVCITKETEAMRKIDELLAE